MTVQTIKITKKQRATLELLARLNENITFRFNNRPSNVAFETDEATIILSELESIKAVLTPSQYAKLRMMFDDTFTYTPRTRRTVVATPVATPVVEVTPVIVQEPVIEEVKLSEPVNLNIARGNMHRDAANVMTQAEFDNLETTKFYKQLKQEPIMDNIVIVEKKQEQQVFNKFSSSDDEWKLSDLMYNEVVDGFELKYQNSFKKSIVLGLSSEPRKVYVENEQYNLWRAFKKEQQEIARREAMLW